MNMIVCGLREGALTLTYNAIMVARGAARRLTRPTQLGVRVLVPRGDELLLVRHRGGRWPWSLPGGGLASHESPADAALRELREEAGCSGRVDYLHGLFQGRAEGMSNHIVIFVCTPLGDARPPIGDLEIVDARFFPITDLPANLDPGSARRIAEHIQGARGLYGPW